ncbi:DNA internalization-related competence protein ComEC/Rec2 [Paraglaciecola sp. 2405UD69-4]|uniref:DNA internalization-related competence protein ComEC/Rec2 n=1 Tax=Paraglaciecola sp. 2405UD69-4 TaxID=3391836 RepID=UPI0039C91F9C
MDSKLFSFIAAAITSLIWTHLPSIFSIIFLIIVILAFAKRYAHFACFLIGIIWMASVGHWQYSLQLPTEQTSLPIVILGKVTTLVHQHNDVRFNLKLSHINAEKLTFSRNIRVSWRNPPWLVQQGQILRLEVKLKPPHGLANEGGFNYQQWLFSKNIVATGYVKNNEINQLVEDEITVRQALLNSLLALELEQVSWIAALSLGYRGLLEQDDWLLVQQSGIAHLIAISGLHLAMVASVSYFLFSWLIAGLVSRFNRLHLINLHLMAMVLTLFTTFIYSSIAGFSLPTLRAWLMLVIASLLFLSSHNVKATRQILIGFTSFLVLFPLSIFGLSFWLSFSAVSIICFVFWRWPVTKAEFSVSTVFLSMLRVQLCLTFLMLPIVAWQFSYVSIVSPLVNLIAVPFVTLCILPLCLMATLLIWLYPELAKLMFAWVDYLIEKSMEGLNATLDFPWAAIELPAMPLTVWLQVLVGFVLLLLPAFVLSKKCLVVLVIPFFSYLLSRQDSHWQVDVLDVGQGTSVLVTKNNQALIYDVGASYPSGFNMADSVLLPILRAKGIRVLDMLVISHGDNDHAGSLPYLEKGTRILHVITTADLCREGYQSIWQDLHIEAFWPDDPQKHSDNNSSCVLKISGGSKSVLLPGDIDKGIEKVLIEKYGSDLKADVLLAPHHGSNTSSSLNFIQHVSPGYVVFSQGFMNRWRFPRPEVVARYQQVFEENNIPQQQIYSTSETGQVSFTLTETIQVRTYRKDIYPYWYANF